jgi:hypothetical protein
MTEPMPQWEYRVIHINVESNPSASRSGNAGASSGNDPPSVSPQRASEHLHGALSPSFIAREFPQHYSPEAKNQSKATHPAEQLQQFLNQLGRDGWDMTATAQVGPLLMFFFKRPLRELPKLITNTEDDNASQTP